MISRRQFLIASGATLAASALPTPSVQAQQSLRLRRDVTAMAANDVFFEQYAAAIRRMHELPPEDPRSWRQQAIIHARFCPHQMADFLQWHRHYLTFFEEICGELIGDPSFALAYWNWSDDRGRMPAVFFGNNPLNVAFWNDPSNFTSSQWGSIQTTGNRALLTPTTGLHDIGNIGIEFTPPRINGLLRLSSFRFFMEGLEGTPHNLAHAIIGSQGGHMGSGMSPLDPIFWLHHCNVDRLWAEWEARGNGTPATPRQYANQFVNAAGVPVTVSANEARDFIALGYTYETAGSGFAPFALFSLEDVPQAASTPTPDEAAQMLGRTTVTETMRAGEVLSIPVATDNLTAELFTSRQFNPTRFSQPQDNTAAMEESRILAVLQDVRPTSDEHVPVAVNVFVNAPSVTAGSTSDDPHFAGSFGFFGDQREFIVDITSALRHLAERGELDNEQVNLQLLPVGLGTEEAPVGSIEVKTVELDRV